VRITWPATTNGMNSGQRYSQRSSATARGFSPSVRYPAIAMATAAIRIELDGVEG
jgi:hypothetical protein